MFGTTRTFFAPSATASLALSASRTTATRLSAFPAAVKAFVDSIDPRDIAGAGYGAAQEGALKALQNVEL